MALDGSRAQYYRQCASELRAKADNSRYPDMKAQFEIMAEQWDALARQVESGRLRR